jgi:hypothetical protein
MRFIRSHDVHGNDEFNSFMEEFPNWGDRPIIPAWTTFSENVFGEFLSS